MKRKIAECMAVVLMIGMMTGCGQEKKDPADAFKGTYVISAEDAAKLADDDKVMFLDARGEKKAGRGTVEGAVATDWQQLSTCSEGNAGDEKWGLVPEPADLEKRLGKLGLDKEKEINIIGEPKDGWGEDGRVLWELLEADFRDVKIVDGGMKALKKTDIPMQKGGSKAKKTKVEIDKLDQSHDISTEELQENYDKYKIVDARIEKEYNGAVLYNEAQGGHLPGAVNIPYLSMLNKDGTLKSNKELEKIFEDAGLEKTDEIVIYCTGGIRSAYMQLVMEMCGYTHTYSYGQSFWRWAVVGDVEK